MKPFNLAFQNEIEGKIVLYKKSKKEENYIIILYTWLTDLWVYRPRNEDFFFFFFFDELNFID